jgi:transposase-like protein
MSTQNIEEMMLERQLSVDHFAIRRKVITYSPQLEADCPRRKRSVRGELASRERGLFFDHM